MLHFCSKTVLTTLARSSSGFTYTRGFGSRPSSVTSSLKPLHRYSWSLSLCMQYQCMSIPTSSSSVPDGVGIHLSFAHGICTTADAVAQPLEDVDEVRCTDDTNDGALIGVPQWCRSNALHDEYRMPLQLACTVDTVMHAFCFTHLLMECMESLAHGQVNIQHHHFPTLWDQLISCV